MSFKMSDVKYNKGKQDINTSIRNCYGLVKQIDILIPNIRIALNTYINYRFTQRNCRYFKAEDLKEMIIGLLEYTIR